MTVYVKEVDGDLLATDNPGFADPFVGAVKAFDFSCDVGEHDPAFVVQGVPHIAWGTSAVSFGAEGAALAAFHLTPAPTRVWALITSSTGSPIDYVPNLSGLVPFVGLTTDVTPTQFGITPAPTDDQLAVVADAAAAAFGITPAPADVALASGTWPGFDFGPSVLSATATGMTFRAAWSSGDTGGKYAIVPRGSGASSWTEMGSEGDYTLSPAGLSPSTQYDLYVQLYDAYSPVTVYHTAGPVQFSTAVRADATPTQFGVTPVAADAPLAAVADASPASFGITPVAVDIAAAIIPTVIALGTAGSFSDNFNRADSSTLGGNWVKVIGTTSRINGNVFDASDTTENRVKNTSISADDVLVQAKLNSSVSGQAIQIAARYQSDGSHYLGLFAIDSPNTKVGMQVYRFSGGSYTSIGTASATIAYSTGMTLRFQVTGTGSTVSFAGWAGANQFTFTATDTSGSRITSAGAVGFRRDTAGTYDDMFACSRNAITITGVPAGWSARISDGTNVVNANVSGSTITLTPSTLTLSASGWTLTIYDGTNQTGTTKFTQTGVYGGDTWGLS